MGRPQIITDPVKKMVNFPREQWRDLWCLCQMRRENGHSLSPSSMVRDAVDIYIRLNHKEVEMAKKDYDFEDE